MEITRIKVAQIRGRRVLFAPDPTTMLMSNLGVINVRLSISGHRTPPTLSLLRRRRFTRRHFPSTKLTRSRAITRGVFIKSMGQATHINNVTGRRPVQPRRIDYKLGISF